MLRGMLRKYDFINWKIDYHLYTAINDRNQNIVDRRRKKFPADGHIQAHEKAACHCY